MSDPSDAGGSNPHRLAPAIDQALLDRLNQLWRLEPDQDTSRSWKQRLAAPMRRAVSRIFRPQETFNAAVVQYVNATAQTVNSAGDRAARVHAALSARERRMEAAMAAMRAEHEELRTTISILQQQIRTARAEQRSSSDARESGAASGVAVSAGSTANATLALSEKYVGFEDQFRGSAESIRARLLEYVPIFDGAANVLDIGCGRGEFLLLLRERGIAGKGIDLNAAMVEVCRQKGLEATQADALAYLRAQPDESLGGLFAAQVVEHLEPAYLTHLLDTAFDKLRPGSAIVLETINPGCWFAFFESYIRDITHVRPLHPDTLKFLLVASGFQRIDIQYRSPYPGHDKLQHVSLPPDRADDAVETLNANVDKLNGLLFTFLDYAAIGRRP